MFGEDGAGAESANVQEQGQVNGQPQEQTTQATEANAEGQEQKQETPQTQEQQERRPTGYQRVKSKLERVEAELAQFKAQLTPQTQPSEPAEPRLEDYEKEGKTWADYTRDLARHEAQKLFKAEQEKQASTTREQAMRSQQQELQRKFEAASKDYAKQATDYYQVTGEADLDMSPALSMGLLESDMGPQLAYYLAKNLDEAEQINQMPYGQAVRALGKLEAKLSQSPPPPKTTQAPPPIRPVGSTAKGEYNPYAGTGTAEDYRKWRETQT